MWAHVTNSVVDGFGPPPSLVFADDRWWDLRPMDPAILNARGWYLVTEQPRPADTATQTADAVYTFDEPTKTVITTWTLRNKTPEESAAAASRSNQSNIETSLRQDLLDVQAVIDATNSTINSSPASSIKTLARVVRRLNKYALRDFGSV